MLFLSGESEHTTSKLYKLLAKTYKKKAIMQISLLYGFD